MDESLKSYLDNQFQNVATKDDLKNFATKDDLAAAVAELGRVISDTIAEPMEKHFAEHKRDLDVGKDVEALKLDMQKIKDALAINDGQPVKIS